MGEMKCFIGEMKANENNRTLKDIGKDSLI